MGWLWVKIYEPNMRLVSRWPLFVSVSLSTPSKNLKVLHRYKAVSKKKDLNAHVHFEIFLILFEISLVLFGVFLRDRGAVRRQRT
jgi:hypothetical protein